MRSGRRPHRPLSTGPRPPSVSHILGSSRPRRAGFSSRRAECLSDKVAHARPAGSVRPRCPTPGGWARRIATVLALGVRVAKYRCHWSERGTPRVMSRRGQCQTSCFDVTAVEADSGSGFGGVPRLRCRHRVRAPALGGSDVHARTVRARERRQAGLEPAILRMDDSATDGHGACSEHAHLERGHEVAATGHRGPTAGQGRRQHDRCGDQSRVSPPQDRAPRPKACTKRWPGFSDLRSEAARQLLHGRARDRQVRARSPCGVAWQRSFRCRCVR